MSAPERSRAFQEFEALHKHELDKFWRLCASTRFAVSWWTSRDPSTWPGSVAEEAGGQTGAVARVTMSPADFIANQSHLEDWARGFTLVAIVTSFETYLRNSLARGLVVRPELLANFKMQIEASALAEPVNEGSVRHWVASRVADHIVRSETHRKVYVRLSKTFRCGVEEAMEPLLAEWDRVNLLRNAIVHEGTVTRELSAAWPDQYPQVGMQVTLRDDDLVRAHDLSMQLAIELDRRYATEVIAGADAEHMVCELYWQHSREPALVASLVRGRLNREVSEERVVELHQDCESRGRRGYP